MTGRVLVTASTLSHIRNFHLPYLRRFQELGYEVHVACGAADGQALDDLPYVQKVIPLPFQKKITALKNFRAVSLLRRQMKETPYDLIVTHTSLAAFFTRLALPRLGRRARVVNMVHGYLFNEKRPGFKDRLLMWAERLTRSRTDLVLTMNQADYDYARAHRLGKEVAFVPGIGVDFSKLEGSLQEDKATLRRILDIPQDAFVFLYAAEFSPRKNQALLIRALAQLPQRAILALPGQGALLESCQALARELGVADRVLFPGQVSEMGPWYALADAAVSSSYSEGLPFNIMEAMYAALPIAATAVKGHTDLLIPGKSGLLFPAGDTAACAKAMKKLLNDPKLCHRLGQAAHKVVLPYALEEVLPQVMERYLSPTSPSATVG